MSFIREIISNFFYPRASSNASVSAANTRESGEEVTEVEEPVSNNGQLDNDARINVASNPIGPAAAGSSEHRHAAGVDIPTILDYEFESVSAAPVRHVERRTRKRSKRRRFTSNTSSMVAEPPSPRNLDDFREHPGSFLPYMVPCIRRAVVKKEESPEPQAGPSRLAQPCEPRQEAQPLHNHDLPSTDSRASKPIKRRRRGPRLTRVKNERAKRAKARAEADARREAVAASPIARRNTRAAQRAIKRDEVEGEADRKKDKGKRKATDVPSTDAAPTGSKRRRVEKDEDVPDGGTSHTTRLTRRRRRIANEARDTARTLESPEQVKQEDDGTGRRKGKGKGKEKAKDVPSTEEAPKGLKRRRDEEDDSGDGDIRQAGSSRPVRRTRQRREAATGPKLEDCDDVKPPTNNVRQLRSRPVPVPDVPAPERRKRHRCSAPEPSDELIDAARKRIKMETPEPTPGPIASSSRVTVEDLVRYENWHSEETSVKLENVQSEAPLFGPLGGLGNDHSGSATVNQALVPASGAGPGNAPLALGRTAQARRAYRRLRRLLELMSQIRAQEADELPPPNHLGPEQQRAEALALRRAVYGFPPEAARHRLIRFPTHPRTDHLERRDTTIYDNTIYHRITD